MEAILIKLAPRIPEYLTRAEAGDPITIGKLSNLGISAVTKIIKGNK